MRVFFQNLAGSMLALCLFFGGAAVFAIVLLVGLIALLGDDDAIEILPGSVLVLDLNATISDAPPSYNSEELIRELVGGRGAPRLYLWQIIDALERAASDDRISSVLLYGTLMVENYGSGYGSLRDVRNALLRFRESGKPVFAFLRNPGVRDYYLASVANEVNLDNMSWLALNGLSAEMIFFGPALDKYGVGVQITRVGDFKSAVEPFTRADFSSESRLQMEELYGQLWQQMLIDIDESRGIPVSELEWIAAEKALLSGEDARDLGLVDRVAPLDWVIEFLKDFAGEDGLYETFRQVSIVDYHADTRRFYGDTYTDRTIAVVYLEGDIVDGEGYSDQAGADRIARELRQLRSDPNIRGIVVRMNSPGGSASASEVIQRELTLCREQKTVVISMGSLAASGAYWIATAGDFIIAEPTTVTGSIGVFGLLFNIRDLAGNHGVSFDGVKTSPFADLGTLTRPMSDLEMEKIQGLTDYLYDVFLQRVADSRGMDRAAVERVAGGRVWTGVAAAELGLIDGFGGLGAAVAEAAKREGISDRYSILQVPDEQALAEFLVDAFLSSDRTPPLVRSHPSGMLSEISRRAELRHLRNLNDPRGIYARLPYWLIE